MKTKRTRLSAAPVGRAGRFLVGLVLLAACLTATGELARNQLGLDRSATSVAAFAGAQGSDIAKRQSESATPSSPGAAPERAPDQHRLGPADAAVQIVVFFDYECEGFERLQQRLRALVDKPPGNVAVTLRHFPLCRDCNYSLRATQHPGACRAARAAEAARMLQGADGFWRMHAWLLARRGQFTDTQLTTSLPELGFDDVPAFLGAMHGKETLRTILTDVIEAQSRRIRTVPTILANQMKFEGRQAEAAVVRALAAEEDPVPPPARGTQKAQTPATIALPDGFSREQLLAAVTATVRIEDTQGRAIGTGAVVGLRPPAAYVLTARHLVPEHSTVLVRTFSAESYPNPAGPPRPASIVARCQHADLAALRFAAPGLNPAILPIRPPPPDTNGETNGERFAALSVGCKAGVPTAQAENVLGGKMIRVREDGPAMSVWEVEGEIAPGASGGPLVDQHGYVLGIASGTGGGQGYFTDTRAIRQFLEEQGLDWLLRPRK